MGAGARTSTRSSGGKRRRTLSGMRACVRACVCVCVCVCWSRIVAWPLRRSILPRFSSADTHRYTSMYKQITMIDWNRAGVGAAVQRPSCGAVACTVLAVLKQAATTTEPPVLAVSKEACDAVRASNPDRHCKPVDVPPLVRFNLVEYRAAVEDYEPSSYW